jgi:phospholipase C
MAKDLSRIKTIVIAMMENRSFDHILGYLGCRTRDSASVRAAPSMDD